MGRTSALKFLAALAAASFVLAVAPSEPAEPAELRTAPVAPTDELIKAAGALMDLRRFDEAITILTLALKQDPDAGLAYADRALANAWTNRVAEAERDLAEAVKRLPPNLAVIHRIRAIIANRKSDKDRELIELSRALEIEPADVFSRSFRSSIYLERRQYEAALADADALIRERPTNPDAYYLRAAILIESHQFERARAEAVNIASRFPSDEAALTRVANLFDELGRRTDALAAIDRAIAINPGYYRSYLTRARIRAKTDRAGRRFDLQEALELAPGDLGIVSELGLLEFDQGNWAEAKARFDQVLLKDERDYGVLAYRAMTRFRLGDTTGAEADYRQAQRVASGPGDHRAFCEFFAREKLLLDWAIESCDRAIEAQPERAIHHTARGYARLQRGETAEALADYNRALEIDPTKGSALYGRGIAKLRLGDLAGAGADRAEAMRLEPKIEEQFTDYGLTDLQRLAIDP